MYNKELFEFISKGNIEKSLYATCIFLIENAKIEILEETLISICAYIGNFIGIREIAKLNDIIISTKNLIENDNIFVEEYLILITKMCILCNIYNINPVSKTGVLPISKLREKILDVFSDDFKLSTNGIMRFEMIIPPTDSEAYLLTLKIISSFIRIIKILDDISSENVEGIELISIKFKNCFDYIIRKKYVIQTKLNPSEHDPIYFLWGFIEILYQQEECINIYYQLFSINYKKSKKQYRIGLLYACAVSIIYSYKRFISKSWNQNELNVIYKTQEISNELILQVKKDIKKRDIIDESIDNSFIEEKQKKEQDKNKIDGIKYLDSYMPIMKPSNPNPIHRPPFQEEMKVI